MPAMPGFSMNGGSDDDDDDDEVPAAEEEEAKAEELERGPFPVVPNPTDSGPADEDAPDDD